MREEYIADGEIHKLEDLGRVRQAYILKKLDKNLDLIVDGEFEETKLEWIGKIAQYIFEANKESFFEILLEHCEDELLDLMKHALNGRYARYGLSPINHGILNMEMIYRPAHMVSIIAHHATLAIKFDRVPNDEQWFKDTERESLDHKPQE